MARSGNNDRISKIGKYPMTTAPTFGTDLTELGSDVASVIGESVPTVGDLPSSGNWLGRTIYVVQSAGQYISNGGALWTPTSPQYCIVGLFGAINSGAVGDAVSSNSAVTDTGLFTVGTNAVIIQRSGMYRVGAQQFWTNNGTGSRIIELTRNNSTMSPRLGDRRAANNVSMQSTSGLRGLSAGDVIRLQIQQDSGAQLNYTGQLDLEYVHA